MELSTRRAHRERLLRQSTNVGVGPYSRAHDVLAGGKILELHGVETLPFLAVKRQLARPEIGIAVGFDGQPAIRRVWLHRNHDAYGGGLTVIPARHANLHDLFRGDGCCTDDTKGGSNGDYPDDDTKSAKVHGPAPVWLRRCATAVPAGASKESRVARV